MKVEKDGIVKELFDESLLRDYLAIGWKEYEEKPAKKIKFSKEEE